MKLILTSLFSFLVVQAASASTVVTCGAPFGGVYVELTAKGKPVKATVSWGYESIPVTDCSESNGKFIICKSQQTENPSSPSIAHNFLQVYMDGDRGIAVFQRTFVPDTYNASSKMEFNDCRRGNP